MKGKHRFYNGGKLDNFDFPFFPSCYYVNLHRGGLQQEPGPADVHQEEGHDQQHHHQHDLLDARAAKQ